MFTAVPSGERRTTHGPVRSGGLVATGRWLMLDKFLSDTDVLRWVALAILAVLGYVFFL
jgi:hypothetical protein